VPTLILLVTTPDSYMNFSLIAMPIMIIYSLYVLKRISGTTGRNFALKAFIFLMLFGVGYFVMIIVQFVLMFATGTIGFEDFIPK
jgi:hypothetical protein